MNLSESTANNFSKYMKRYPDLYINLANIIKKIEKDTNKIDFIVDVGSGPGFLSIYLNEIFPNTKIIEIEPSLEMIEIGKNIKTKKKIVNIYSIRSISEKIPLINNSVNIVVTRFSLPYWKKPDEGFKELYRILRNSGIIVIEALNKEYPKWKLYLTKINMTFKLAGKDVIKYHVNSYKNAYKNREVKDFLKKAGFNLIYEEYKPKNWKFLIIAEK